MNWAWRAAPTWCPFSLFERYCPLCSPCDGADSTRTFIRQQSPERHPFAPCRHSHLLGKQYVEHHAGQAIAPTLDRGTCQVPGCAMLRHPLTTWKGASAGTVSSMVGAMACPRPLTPQRHRNLFHVESITVVPSLILRLCDPRWLPGPQRR